MFRINFWVFLCILYSTSSLVVAADFLNVTDVQSFRLMCKNHMTSPFLDFIKREHYLRLVNTGNADESYLEGMTLNSADFKSKTLSFKKACLRNVVFIGSFQNADFTGVDLRSSDLSRTDFSGANFDEAHLINCNLSNGNFSGTTFRHACLDGSYGESVIMKNANFESASLIAVFWSGDTNGSSLKDANVELMQKTAAVFKAKCIDPDFCMYMRQLKEPGRIVFEYNPKNSVADHDMCVKKKLLQKKVNEVIALNIVGLNEIEKQIVAIYVYGIFPKIRKNIQHRYVMHCVSDEILAQLKAKSPMLFEELRSNLVEEVCSDSDD